jgi:mannitol 2-dehydrogenase
VGGFSRAHLALYTHELAAQGSDWGIRGLGLLRGDRQMAGALTSQDFLYTLTEKDSDASRACVIGSIIDFVLASDDAGLAHAAIADPETSILSLTITESGYAEPATPSDRTTIDILVAGLDARRQVGLGGLTILSCDNLPGNGDVARAAFASAAGRRSEVLADWVTSACTLPNSMVDRITPVTAQSDRDWLETTLGIQDRWPVVAEPFRQWVIEDRFVDGRPGWDAVGALLTDDVHSWELYKLRFLNAGHSCMAYLCALAGIEFVDEAISTPVVLAYLNRLLRTEALPTLTEIPGFPREDYIAVVLERFANTGVRDQISRLCIDGTAKFPTFLIPTIVRQLQVDGPLHCSALALAGWLRYLATVPREEQSFDAAGDKPREYAAAAAEPVSFLDFVEVFPEELRVSPRFRSVFAEVASLLESEGPLRAMEIVGTLS